MPIFIHTIRWRCTIQACAYKFNT